MEAGKREWKVTIRRKTVTKGSFGEDVATWADYAPNLWAARETLSANEKLALQEVSAEQTLRFKLPYSSLVSGVRATDQVVFEGRDFRILSVEETEKRREIAITATARAE